ncbi:hypothetical protein CERZMDRAFT_96454 [Cercospora zeae-maydis SCOH1-5]|uniref:Uncharacterized protein n=1 Tax=Cercospora zeae-maydis SCOH1-5 TaxID=717836 RepID=A0A6A6FJP6_9PEZI|nr:hypothetical protein CERZMDRAFT_96454 [Cercospora zeae-maydis SCOH1-5]
MTHANTINQTNQIPPARPCAGSTLIWEGTGSHADVSSPSEEPVIVMDSEQDPDRAQFSNAMSTNHYTEFPAPLNAMVAEHGLRFRRAERGTKHLALSTASLGMGLEL